MARVRVRVMREGVGVMREPVVKTYAPHAPSAWFRNTYGSTRVEREGPERELTGSHLFV